jgi:glycosyltransferase involved in cell wall biosynthesis
MDLAIVQALSEANLGTILLAGPHNNPDPELLALPDVVAPGPLPLEQLPGLARLSSVLIMPYADLPVTQAMQPLKLKEYLATGLPCVVSDLPANREWADCLDLVESPEAFVTAVKRRLVEGVPEGQRLARQRLSQESWQEKARRFEQLIDGGGHG